MISRYKGTVRDGPGGPGPPLEQCEWSKRYVHLFEFLTADRWDDGSEREPGTLLLCSGEGRIRVWLNNRAEGLSAWLSGSTVTEALGAIEAALASGTVDWRRARGPRKKA